MKRLELRFPSDEEDWKSERLISRLQPMVHPYCGGSLHCSSKSCFVDAPSHCCCCFSCLLLLLLHCMWKVLEKHLMKRQWAWRWKDDKSMSSLDVRWSLMIVANPQRNASGCDHRLFFHCELHMASCCCCFLVSYLKNNCERQTFVITTRHEHFQTEIQTREFHIFYLSRE